jgi:hypothetical protein
VYILDREGKTVLPGGNENFHGRQVLAFESEDLAGTGEIRLPGNFKMPAF